MRYIVTYDVREKRRLQKIFRLLSGYALPLQESVFIFVGDVRKFEAMKVELCATANLQQDDIRIYPLGNQAKVWEWDHRSQLDGLFLAL